MPIDLLYIHPHLMRKFPAIYLPLLSISHHYNYHCFLKKCYQVTTKLLSSLVQVRPNRMCVLFVTCSCSPLFAAFLYFVLFMISMVYLTRINIFVFKNSCGWLIRLLELDHLLYFKDFARYDHA